jgi:hypothetical protein
MLHGENDAEIDVWRKLENKIVICFGAPRRSCHTSPHRWQLKCRTVRQRARYLDGDAAGKRIFLQCAAWNARRVSPGARL